MDHIIIQINGINYKVKQTWKGLILWEQMAKKPVSLMEETITDMLMLLFCFLRANNMDTFQMSYENFIDAIDEDNKVILVFSDYVRELNTEEKKFK